MTPSSHKARAPLFPVYSEVRELLRILDGVSKDQVKSLIYTIRDQTGTPQNPVDWSDPAVWIPARLDGENAELARMIWVASKQTINPRYVYWMRHYSSRMRWKIYWMGRESLIEAADGSLRLKSRLKAKADLKSAGRPGINQEPAFSRLWLLAGPEVEAESQSRLEVGWSAWHQSGVGF